MKAEIDAKGVLTVSAEMPLEQFALRKWSEENAGVKEGEGRTLIDGGNFLIRCGNP